MNKWLTLVLLFATSVALALRCPRLAGRPMHNDEAVNAVKFGQLSDHGLYKYDPQEYHGPTLAYATLLVSRLSGSPDFAHLTEARLRLITVFFGVGLILVLPLIGDGLGKTGLAWAGMFTAVSPAMVFYSRYYIHEMLLIWFAFFALAAGWRYWRTRKIGWALAAGASAGLMHATKETFVISVVAGSLALGLNQLWNRWLDASGLPVRAPRLDFKHLGAAGCIWLIVAVMLFSSFFTNAQGPFDSVRSYSSWFHLAGGSSPHIHSWNFYWQRLIFFHSPKGPVWSEALILALGVVGMAAAFTRKGMADANASFVRFLALYTIFLAGAYTLIGYKTPWCLLNFWHGMILLAGVGGAVLVHLTSRPWAKLALNILFFAGASQLAAQAWQASNQYAADPRNPYVYAQTSPNLLDLVNRVESLAQVHPQGHQMLVKTIAPESDFWPLPWYLRRFSRAGWWDSLPADPFAPVMIVSSKFHAGLDEGKTHLMTGYFELRPGAFFELYVEVNLWRAWLAKNPVRPE